ncbi:MAG: endonuclease/exonuclease/phosphatase family protein [Desulfobulbus sp.]
MALRFLLYNIRYGTGHGRGFNFPFPGAGYLRPTQQPFNKILDFIREVSPDVMGLVEIDDGSFRTGQRSQAEMIADQLGYHYVIETKYGSSSLAHRIPLLKTQGNAVFTREPIISHRFHYFDEGVKRLIIQVCTERLTVFLVHLSLTYRNRQYQLERLYRLIRRVDRAMILAGDFNVLWGTRELEMFLGATGLISANPERKPSFPSQAPTRVLDFILHSPELRVIDFHVPEVTYSDHAPLICDFDF